jgi:transposase
MNMSAMIGGMLCSMQVRYRYRIYPSPGQQQALARVFGCARVVYNGCLRVRDEAYEAGEMISGAEVQRRVLCRRPQLAAVGAEAGTHRSAA